MMTRETCPAPSVWRRVVDEGFAETSVDDLGEHLDGCPTCQAAVESLMRGKNAWLAIAAILRQELPPASPVCEKKLEFIKESDPPSPEPASESDYGIRTGQDNPHKSAEVQEYVQYLENQARIKEKREPYRRKRFPIDFWAGVAVSLC